MRPNRDRETETQRRFEHAEGAIAATRDELYSLWEIVMKHQREIEALKRKRSDVASARRPKKYERK